MAHMIWKGAISFGLVHVPVQLYPATQSESVGFNLLDKRSMDPIGYKQINKKTGKEVTRKSAPPILSRRKRSIFSPLSKRPTSRFSLSIHRTISRPIVKARRCMRYCAMRSRHREKSG
jgi:hypothetical protein